MKVIIQTVKLEVNYGGVLQCYALQTALEKLGYDVKVLSEPKYSKSYYFIWGLAILKRAFKRLLFNEKIPILHAPYQIIGKNVANFVERKIHRYVKSGRNSSTLRGFDCVVVGSDQVWRPIYNAKIEDMYLSYAENNPIRRISYAASFGIDSVNEYTSEQLKRCSSLLKKFDAVSVRESSGVAICKNDFGVDAVHVLDSTLLLTADDYRDLASQAETVPSKGKLLAYFLDIADDKLKVVDYLAKKYGLTPFFINQNYPEYPLEQRIQIPVEQWIRGFDDADFVVTDSFHGCVFSLIFNKQFVALANLRRGEERFSSLLNQFSIRRRLFSSYADFINNQQYVNETIDYQKINELLEVKRKEAFLFLKENISQ